MFFLNITHRLISFIFVFFFLLICVQKPLSQIAWSSFVDSVSTLSSPRSADLNNDGIKDLVVGSGTDSTFSTHGIVAFDGNNGNLLWNLATTDEIFTSAIFNDINNDLIPDVFMGGRNAQLYAIDGATGTVIWEYFPQNLGLNPSDSGLYNFYSSQWLSDLDGDNVSDILVTNGGDNQASPFDPRPAGNLMVISGATGAKLAMALSPDSAEIYCSPVILDHGNSSSPYIVFGTGGEQNPGGMYITSLYDLMNNNISNAVMLTSHPVKGFIAPASLADVNDDGFSDIIVQSFAGEIQAFDGLTYQSIWSNLFSGCESSSAPTIGNFTGGDLVPDVFNVVYKGTTPTYFEYYQFMINGATGELVFLDSIGTMQFPSSSAFDANGDGRDEVVISVNYISNYFSHQIKLIDFQNDTVFDLTTLQAGVNLACTPLIDDLDSDGNIEIIYTCKTDSTNPSAWNGFDIFRLNTNYQLPSRGIAWGAYMGTNYGGIYNNLLSFCTGSNMITSWNAINPSCNLFSDGKIIPLSYNYNPATFLWSNGDVSDSIIDIPAGSYNVYLTDTSNCLEIHYFQLNDPYLISFGNLVHNNCIGDSTGSVTVSSSGCVCQFSTCTYNWANGSLIKHANNLPAGYQTVVLTHADGCIVSDSVLINDGLPVLDSSNINHLNCYNIYDGVISLYPSDPSSTQFNWSNGDTNSIIDHLPSGNYSVIVNNTFCTDSISFTINAPDTLSFSYNIQNVYCHGDSSGSISVSPFGGTSPYEFSINGTLTTDSIFNNLPFGTYLMHANDAVNCFSDSFQLNVTQPDSLTLSFSSIPETDSGYFDGSITASVSGGTLPYDYQWGHLTGLSDSILIYLSSGLYNLLVLDANGCQISDSINLGMLSSKAIKEYANINVYPIPSSGNVTLSNGNNKCVNFSIVDLNGKILIDHLSVDPFQSIQINLPAGHYLIKSQSENILISKKILIVP